MAIMDAAAVREIRRKMDQAHTAKSARQSMARLAISYGAGRGNLTDCGRDEWEKELASSD